MVEKVPKFSAESLCLRQGIATSGRCCPTLLLCVQNVSSEIMCPESKNIHSQIVK